jgi:GNAT superfamily N-acetyltransferase
MKTYKTISLSNIFENNYINFQKKFVRNIRDYGIWTSTKKSIAFFIKPVYHKKTFIIYQLNLESPPKAKIDSNGFSLKLLEPDDDDLINQIEVMEEWLSGTLRPLLKANGICMAVVKDNRVAGFNLATLGEGFIALLKLRIKIRENEAWSEQISIHKEFRRKGLANLLRSKFYYELKNRGVTALYGHRQVWNIASEKSAHKYTQNVLVKAEYLKIIKFEKLRYKKFLPLNSGNEMMTKHILKQHYRDPIRQFEFVFGCDINYFRS